MKSETVPVSYRRKHATNPVNLRDGDFHIINKKHLKENATVFPYSNMFFPQLRRVDMYLSRLSPCT